MLRKLIPNVTVLRSEMRGDWVMRALPSKWINAVIGKMGYLL